MKEATHPCVKWTAAIEVRGTLSDGHCSLRVAIVIGPNKCLIQKPRRAGKVDRIFALDPIWQALQTKQPKYFRSIGVAARDTLRGP